MRMQQCGALSESSIWPPTGNSPFAVSTIQRNHSLKRTAKSPWRQARKNTAKKMRTLCTLRADKQVQAIHVPEDVIFFDFFCIANARIWQMHADISSSRSIEERFTGSSDASSWRTGTPQDRISMYVSTYE